MVNGSTSISGIDTQMENSDTAICILRPNEISSPAHMMSWLLVKRESIFLTWQQKLRISSAQKIQHSNAVHSTHGIFSFGATSLTWRCYFKSLLRMKTMDTFQRIYSKGCLSGFKTKSRFSDRPSRTSRLIGHRKCQSGLLSVNCDFLIAIRSEIW